MLKLRSLQAHIVVLFMLLMLFVQLAGLVVSQTTITENVRTSVGEQLVAGEKVLRHLLAQNGQQLEQAGRVLAADHGFREALATEDREPIDSALRNHGARIGAGIALLVGLDRHVRAGTSSVEAVGAEFRHPELLALAEQQGTATGIAMLGGRLYQLVVVPVRSPATIAWVVMGFAVDGALAAELLNLSNVQVTILAGGESKAWSLIASTLPGSSGSELLGDLPRLPPADRVIFETSLDGDKYATLVTTLWRTGDRTAVAVLQHSIGQAIAPYLPLQVMLLIVTLVGLTVSGVGSVVAARSVGRQVKALAAFAKRLERGDYSKSLEIRPRDETGKLASAFNHMRDGIATREHKITTLAYRDMLTGLPNRARFAQTLAQALVAAQESRASLAVMIMDLDSFRHVNDVFGHHLGDLLLREVASRLQSTLLRRSDTVARLGGDEFAVLIRCEPMDNVLVIAQRLLAALEKPVVLDGQVIDMGASIGIATYPEDGSDANILLSRADVAMYAAKRTRGCALAYDSKLDQNNQENPSLTGDLPQRRPQLDPVV